MTTQKRNGNFTFLPDSEVEIQEQNGNMTREPWLMLMARRNRKPTETLCWGLTNSGSSFARIGTQEGDLINGFVHEDPYKARLLGPYLYITEGKQYFTNTWYPVMNPKQKLTTRYGFGTLTSETAYNRLSVTTTSFIPNEFDGMLQLVTIKNLSGKRRRLRLFSVNPVNIGDARGIQFSGFNTLMMGGGAFDQEINGLVWRNHGGIPFTDNPEAITELFGKVLVHTTSDGCDQFSTKYEDFVGHYSGGFAKPDALTKETLACRPAEELTSALSTVMKEITIEPRAEYTMVIATVASSTEDYYCHGKTGLKKILEKVRSPEKVRQMLEEVRASWKKEMDLVRIDVPGESDFMHSFKWLQYQCSMVACLNRMKSRFHSGFEYGYGFRDILQDLLALLPYDAKRVRDTLMFVAEQMFSDGSVYHNFFVSANGNRDFNACDDPLWLVYAVCEYVKETGDRPFLDAKVPYADKKEGLPEAEGTMLDHCILAVNRVWDNSNEGLPVMLDADWNDDLSGYDCHVSVMTAQMLFKALNDLTELSEELGIEDSRFAPFTERAATVRDSVNKKCIDREGRYIRLVSTDKSRAPDLGSCDSDGLTFFEPVAWAGYSGIATREQFLAAAGLAEKALHDRTGFALCPADTNLANGKLPADGSAWRRNAPGKKENGGVFRHPESWYIASLCRFGYGNRAYELYRDTLPAVSSERDPHGYAAERFVYPEYVSGPDSNEHGRAGHTWLTGTAPTRAKVLLESIFGLEPTYGGLRINPCVSSSWKEFSVYRKFRDTGFSLNFQNPEGVEKGELTIAVDGTAVDGSLIPAQYYDGKEHTVTITMRKGK